MKLTRVRVLTAVFVLIAVLAAGLLVPKPTTAQGAKMVYAVEEVTSKLTIRGVGGVTIMCDPQRGNFVYLAKTGGGTPVGVAVVHQPDLCK